MLLTEQQKDNQILNIQISDLSAFTNMLFRSAEQKHGHTDIPCFTKASVFEVKAVEGAVYHYISVVLCIHTTARFYDFNDKLSHYFILKSWNN